MLNRSHVNKITSCGINAGSSGHASEIVYNASMTSLRFDSSVTEAALRAAIVECGKICYANRLMTSNDGNISARLGDDSVLITPSGRPKARMDEVEILILDLDGNVIAAPDGCRPSSETPMHLEVYRQRPGVRAAIHAHPVFATALTVAGIEFPSDVLPEVLLTLGDVPTTGYATPSSHEDAEAVREWIGDHNAILLRQHGSLTVGKDLEEALIHLERIEHVAEVFWRAQALGTVNRISGQARQQLLAVRERLFGSKE